MDASGQLWIHYNLFFSPRVVALPSFPFFPFLLAIVELVEVVIGSFPDKLDPMFMSSQDRMKCAFSFQFNHR